MIEGKSIDEREGRGFDSRTEKISVWPIDMSNKYMSMSNMFINCTHNKGETFVKQKKNEDLLINQDSEDIPWYN